MTRELYAGYLSHLGMRVIEIDSLSSFGKLSTNTRSTINLVLLDLNLPDGDGMTLLKQIQPYSNTAVIVVTACEDEVERIRGLNLGADDFLVKPVSPKEIYARIQAILRRFNVNKNMLKNNFIRVFKYFSIDQLSRQILKNTGQEIILTNSEFSLLQVFIEHPNQPLSREFLQNKVSSYGVDVHSRLVDTLVSRLRKKLNSSEYNMIHTVYGLGYQFYSE